MKRNQDGFTLVEMMVTIVIGSLVTLAATTVLLLGLRINNRSTQTVTRQNTARVVITMLENLAAEGEITSINQKKDAEDNVIWWEIRSAENVVLATYSNQSIYVGSAEEDPDGPPATPLLEEVMASKVSLDKTGLLSISVTIDGTPYESSIYCRTMRKPLENELAHQAAATNPTLSEPMSATEKAGRLAFLNALASQYRMAGGSPNPGLILDGGKYSTGDYYSEWYVGHYGEDKPGWGPETPWCACFISWGLCYPGKDSDGNGIVENSVVQYINPDTDNRADGGVAFANVDFFWEYFKELERNTGKDHWKPSKALQSDATDPIPGDIIFIDWDKGQGTNDYDPAHVGVVLKVEGGYVYTIEGNRDNRVMVCKYALNDPIIMGYGIIDWATTEDELNGT